MRIGSLVSLGALGLCFLVACGGIKEDDPGGTGATSGATTTGVGDGDGDGDGDGEGDGDGDGESGESGDGDGDGDGDSQFVPTSDMPSVNMCDIWNPDDCPDGEKCTAYATMGSSWDANKCVMIMGNGQPGDDCMATDGSGVSGNDDCDKGSMCWDIDGDTMLGYCVDFCTGSANNPMCTGDSLCAIYNNGVLPLCLATCDPLSGGGDCPNTDNLCISDPGGQGFVCVLDASGGMGTYGTECQYANSCNQGLFCAAADAVPNCQGAQGCCSEFCDVNEANMCSGAAMGQECVPWYEEGMAPPGYEHVGGCAIPE